MCSGENSVPTWPFHCFDKSILTIDRSPELTAVTPRPSVKNTPDGSILESRAPTTPVALRPVSASHAPAVVSAPGAQFRKDCWHPQKPSFGRWLRKRQRFFRNWAPGDSLVAGAHNEAGLPDISGKVSRAFLTLNAKTEGAFNLNDKNVGSQSGGESAISELIFSASKSNTIYGNSATVMPASVNHPVCLYLGRPA